MAGARWKEEREEIIELIYLIQADHYGSLPEREARKFGPWAATAIKRARRIRWLVSKGSPPILSVTKKGSRALDEALASRSVSGLEPHWFGGSIVSLSSETGPVLPAQSYEPYNELRRWAMERGILTQEDIDHIANSSRQEPQEPEEYATLEEMSFPGTRVFAGVLEFEDSSPLGGGSLDASGYEGPYQVTITLTRRGAPDLAFAYVTDPFMMEGDSHLKLPEYEREGNLVRVPLLTYDTHEGETLQFQLLANGQGRLGQISTIFRARDATVARRRAHRILNPFLCDLSYQYDVPIEVLQTNVTEIATYTLSGVKQDDFREKFFDPEQFLGSSLNYENLPNYEFFMRLYREGANSSSVDYGFLCFYRIAEGVIKLRRKRIIDKEGRNPKEVPESSVFTEGDVVEGEEASKIFSEEALGESLWTAFSQLEHERVKVAHAFLHSEDPVSGHNDIISERLEGEERAATRRAQARYIARRMLESEFRPSNDSA